MTKRENAELTVNERVWTVTLLLHSNFTRKRWKRISVRQLINRLLLLFQRPIIFVVYKSESSDWECIFHSHRDYAYQQLFRKQIVHKFHTQEGRYQPDLTTKMPKTPQPIPGTKFGIILIGVCQVTTTSSDSPDSIQFTPIAEGAEEYRLLGSLWNIFLKSQYSESVGVTQRLSLTLDALFEKAIFDPQYNNEIPEPNDNKLMPEVMKQQIKVIQDQITESIYSDLEHSPLISNKGKRPRNIFFLLRYYDEALYRNRSAHKTDQADFAYPYSIRILLPPSQKDDIRKSFNKMRNLAASRDKVRNKWLYQYEDENDGSITPKDNDEYPDSQWAEWFWQALEADEGLDTFIGILTSPFGQGTRGLADPALASGFVHFRASIFSDGGINRIHPSMRGIEVDSEDMKRIVILHYLFGAASPATTNKDNMGAMIVPLRTGYKTYMTITQVTVMEEEGNVVGKDAEHWLRNIHFFNDVGRHAVQRLRYHSKTAYLNQIKDIFAEIFKRNLVTKNNDVSSKPRIASNVIEDEINRQYVNLCRVWPYPLVEVSFEGGRAPDGDENSVSMGEGIDSYHLRFTLEEKNVYYNHLAYTPIDVYTHKHGFIEIDEIKTCLEKAVGEIRRHIASRA